MKNFTHSDILTAFFGLPATLAVKQCFRFVVFTKKEEFRRPLFLVLEINFSISSSNPQSSIQIFDFSSHILILFLRFITTP